MELESTTLTYSWICIFWFSIIIWKSSRCTTYWTSDQFFQAARTFIFCWRTPRTSVAGYKIGIINLLCFLSATCIDTMNIADSFQFVIRPCTTFVAPAIFLYTVKLGDKEIFGHPKLFLNAKCSLSLWSKLTIGHVKWFFNTNLFLISKFDCTSNWKLGG